MSASLTSFNEPADPLLLTSCHNPSCREALQKCKLEIAGLYREAAESRTIKAEQADQEAVDLGKDATIDRLLKELQEERDARKHVEQQMNDSSERERHLHTDLVAANKTMTDLKAHVASYNKINAGTLKLIHRDMDDHHVNTSSDSERLRIRTTDIIESALRKMKTCLEAEVDAKAAAQSESVTSPKKRVAGTFRKNAQLRASALGTDHRHHVDVCNAQMGDTVGEDSKIASAQGHSRLRLDSHGSASVRHDPSEASNAFGDARIEKFGDFNVRYPKRSRTANSPPGIKRVKLSKTWPQEH